LPWWAWAILLGATIAVYANALSNGFHYDDKSMIIRNAAVQHVERLPEHFWSVTLGKQEGAPSYRPLVMVSYGLNYWWSETNPQGYHVVDIALHAIASVLVVLVVWNLSGLAVASLFGGLVFALHPIHTEAVNYITARSSVLYSAAALAAVLAYVRFRASGRVALLALSVLAYSASLLAKEAAVAVPLLLVGYDVIVRRKRWVDLPRWGIPHIPLVLLTVGYLVFRRVMVGQVMASSYHGDLMTVGLTFAAVVAKTLSGQLLPIGLSVSHPFGPIQRLTVQALWAIAVLTGFVVVWAAARRRAPVLAYAAMWFPIVLLPLAPLSVITPLALYQENRGYLSAVALAMVAGPLLAQWWEGVGTEPRRLVPRRAVVFGLFGAMAIAIVTRNPVWRDDVSLWRDALKKAPGNQAAYVNLGAAYQARGELPEAVEVYRRALERFPGNSFLRNNLGAVYLSIGDRAQAAEQFRTAIQTAPTFAMPYFNLGLVLQGSGAREEAAAAYQRFLEFAPGQPGTAVYVPKAQQRLAELKSDAPMESSPPN
jgi:hypothetical protein